MNRDTSKAAPRIVVEVSGGMVQRVSCDSAVEVLLIDYDCDGTPPDERVQIPTQDGGTEPAGSAEVMAADVDGLRVAELFRLAEMGAAK